MKTNNLQFNHLGSLITYQDGDGERCLGNLMHFEGHGVYDPGLGRVEIDPVYVEPHNRALDQAMIEGLDQNCQVGQGGFFYFNGKQVSTFMGLPVSADFDLRGKTLTFRRKGRTFRGRLSKQADSFNFRRVS